VNALSRSGAYAGVREEKRKEAKERLFPQREKLIVRPGAQRLGEGGGSERDGEEGDA